jgi:hypothetical protein
MDELDIIKFAESNLERITSTDGGPAYRCSAFLNDGVHLPCVLIASIESHVELATRRLEEARADGLKPESERRFGYRMTYPDLISTFTTKGNCVNHYDIARLERSSFAIPLARLQEVKGETSMSWTQFSAVMRDGSEFFFGTSYLTEFFHMPHGYTGDDITTINPHRGGRSERTYRERPFFTCYVPLVSR